MVSVPGSIPGSSTRRAAAQRPFSFRACQAVRSAMANGMTLRIARHQADQAIGYVQQDMGLNLSVAYGMHLGDAAVGQLC